MHRARPGHHSPLRALQFGSRGVHALVAQDGFEDQKRFCYSPDASDGSGFRSASRVLESTLSEYWESSPVISALANASRPLLDLPVVRQTRRNHGLEHATIHILSRRVKKLRMAGRSDAGGFFLWGDVPTATVEAAATEALRRLKAGEKELAIHPNCGTNLVTTAFLATSGAMLGMLGADRKNILNRMPVVMTLVLGALVAGQPLGTALQRDFTTDGDPGDLEIVRIERTTPTLIPGRPPTVVHRVTTRST